METEIRIERMAPEGKGLARWEGRIVFVPYSAPGDRLKVSLDKVKESYALGRILKVLEPGPGRIDPPCPLHYRPPESLPSRPPPCGGCDWQHLDYAQQLEAKRELLRDCLKRIAKLPDIEVADAVASPLQWRYRNKVQVPFASDRGRIAAGFYAPGSHRIVDFSDCPIQPELSVRLALKTKQLASELGWPVYDEDRHSGWLRHLFVRTNRRGQALLALVSKTPAFPKRERFLSQMRQAFPELVAVFQNLQPLKTSVILGPRWVKLWGADALIEELGPLRLRVSPGAFLQVNSPACELLYDAALEELTHGGLRPGLALDLYCGIGAIALWIAPRCARVLGVEENREAVADAWENARLNGIKNARFLSGSVESALGRLRREFDAAAPGSAAAVLDPPRAGLTPGALKALGAPALGRLVYVSCNPATFARDAAGLVQGGWRLKRVRPFDMFPQTSHVELVARFDR